MKKTLFFLTLLFQSAAFCQDSSQPAVEEPLRDSLLFSVKGSVEDRTPEYLFCHRLFHGLAFVKVELFAGDSVVQTVYTDAWGEFTIPFNLRDMPDSIRCSKVGFGTKTVPLIVQPPRIPYLITMKKTGRFFKDVTIR